MSDITIPAGMKAWTGGNEAPADWDGGAVYLDWGCGEFETYTDKAEYLTWKHDPVAGDNQANIIAYTPKASCLLCTGKCRGHGLADPKAWEPEKGSVAEAVAEHVKAIQELMRSAILRDISAEQKRYNEGSPTWRAFGFCIDIAEKATTPPASPTT